VQAVLGRVDSSDTLVDPQAVPMVRTGTRGGDVEIFSVTTPLPVAGTVGYTVRILPHNDLLAGDNELGLIRLAGRAAL
jgi:starch phosphorylase